MKIISLGNIDVSYIIYILYYILYDFDSNAGGWFLGIQ